MDYGFDLISRQTLRGGLTRPPKRSYVVFSETRRDFAQTLISIGNARAVRR
jgi:hypothetical protein